jgi:hypothetical protein
MMYRVPRPSRSNGVKIHTIGDHEIGIEYTVGEPHVGKMAYDSSCGIMSRNISFRRPDIEKIVADAVRQVDREDAMPRAGKSPIRSLDMASNDDDDTSAALGRVLEFLENIVSPDDLEIVQALFCGAADVDEAREAQAVARRDDDRQTGRQAADAARRRPMSQSTEDVYARMFPNQGRLA